MSPSILPLIFLVSTSVQPSFPVPLTPDALVENFERSLEEMDVGEYERLLDWSYLFDFAPDHEWMAPEGWQIDEELDAMRRLLGGEPSRHDGHERRVAAIDVEMRPMGPWEETHEDPLGVLRTWQRDYDARIVVEFDDDTKVRIHRRQVLTVISGYDEARMELREFKLLRWEEEESLVRPFGSMKARF